MNQIIPFHPFLKTSISFFYSLWKFSRPHTIIGTSLSVLALYSIGLAITQTYPTTNNIIQLLGTWFACLLGNIYIVGLNQVEDIEIDKINKPHLPIAAGEFSKQKAQWIVSITGILALVLSGYLGIWLLATVSISLAIGTAYSLPPIRLKRFPFWAAFCIFTVRGVIVNLGIFLHFSNKLAESKFLPLEIWALTLFILVFTIAIAIFKDVPDMEGDKEYNISTLTILLGKSNVFNIARWIISVCYLGIILAAIFWLSQVNNYLTISTHLILLSLLWWRSFQVNLEDKKEIANFYQFIWKLFFLEYILFPIVCF